MIKNYTVFNYYKTENPILYESYRFISTPTHIEYIKIYITNI